MSLEPGSRFGPYDVVSSLGKGGMGEVFRARDSRLGRDVALKLLPPEWAQDAERVARFKREAQLLAALSHPNIAAIHGLEEQDGRLALVLELVEGDDLAERLKRGPLPIDEAIPVARQIAEALEEAHEKGIVHRDLKPANVKLTPDGKVKVLDFGLAKALGTEAADGSSPQLSHSPTLTRNAEAGMVMGTAAYMSPEQARGKPVDKRSDVWAFGVVLYELLTGRRLFEGETISDVIASVLKTEIDWSALPADTPVQVRRLLERCLERDPKRRLRDIGEARLALESPAAASITIAAIPPPPASAPAALPAEQSGGRRSLRAGFIDFAIAHPFAAVVIVGIVGIVLISRRGGGREPAPVRREPGLRLKTQLTEDKLFDDLGSAAVLSPDGRTIAFVVGEGAKTSLHVRRLDALASMPVPESLGARSPFFSPDGQWVGFFANGRLLKAPATAAAPSEICRARDGRGASWGKGDVIVFSGDTQSGLMRVSAQGGTPEPLTSLDAGPHERTHRWPFVLPDGENVLFVVQTFGQDYDEATIEVVSLKTKKRHLVHKGGTYPRYARSGHLLFARRGVLYAARIDADSLTLKGPPRQVIAGLMASPANEAQGDGSAQFDVSAGGMLLYRLGQPVVRDAQLSVLDPKGVPSFAEAKRRAFSGPPRFSPDGSRIATSIDARPGIHVWLYDVSRRVSSQLTSEQSSMFPEWTPDGRFVTFVSTQLGLVSGPWGPSGDAIFFVNADGSGQPELLFRAEGRPLYTRSFSPDGRLLTIQVVNEKTSSDVTLLRLDGPIRHGVKVSAAEPLLATDAEEASPAVSPNGRLLAWAESTDHFQWRVLVGPFPEGGTRREIGRGGFPHWSGDGRTLYYQNDGRLFSVSVEARGALASFGDEHAVFAGAPVGRAEDFYEAAPDGKRFAAIRFPESDVARADASDVILAFDWTDELKRLFDAR